MTNYILSPAALVMVSGSSKGTQNKYFENNYWYKVNEKGCEGLVENLVSEFLRFTNIHEYVSYERCTINNKAGCRSLNFLQPQESFISLQRLFDMYHGGNLQERITPMNTVKERIDVVKQFVFDTVHLDISDYLSKILTLDMVTLNTDRHFNNLGIIINAQTGEVRPAPIFDNGAALLSNFSVFPMGDDVDTCVENAKSLPFSSSFEMQVSEVGIGMHIDYPAVFEWLKTMPDSRSKQVLEMQIKKYQRSIPEKSLTQDAVIEKDDLERDD